MSFNLVAAVMQQLSPDLTGKMAKALGLDHSVATKAIGAMVPGILGGVVAQSAKPAGAEVLGAMLGSLGDDSLPQIAGMIGGASQGELVDEGTQLIGQAIGETETASMTAGVAKYAGLSDAAGKGLMGMVGPAVVASLANQVRSQGIGADGLPGFLAGQKGNIAAGLPADYMRLNVSGLPSAGVPVGATTAGVAAGVAAAAAAGAAAASANMAAKVAVAKDLADGVAGAAVKVGTGVAGATVGAAKDIASSVGGAAKAGVTGVTASTVGAVKETAASVATAPKPIVDDRRVAPAPRETVSTVGRTEPAVRDIRPTVGRLEPVARDTEYAGGYMQRAMFGETRFGRLLPLIPLILGGLWWFYDGNKQKQIAAAEKARIEVAVLAKAKADAEAAAAAAAAAAKARTDADARMKAEAEATAARARADAEAAAARARAEAEARQTADADAAAARARADAAARQKAEADAAAAKRLAEIKTCQETINQVAATGPMRFRVASASLTPDSTATLDRLAGAAKACPAARLRIEGHTDADGDASANQTLSENRARAVADYLAKAGVETAKMTAVGFGQTKPRVANDTPENKAQNRRIDFVVSGN